MQNAGIRKFWAWLFRPQNDMRPISWLIGYCIMLTIIFSAFFGPIIYLDNYSGGLPINVMTGVLALGTGAVLTALVLWGDLMFGAIDALFDICCLIKQHRAQ